jgi:CRISPR-associated protein Cmr4
MNARVLTMYAETPLHPGTGQTTGVVDLPIQRERHTGFPKIEATGLKGALRDAAERKPLSADEITAIFGPDTANASDHAGALAPTDVRILAFPVRSLTDVFVWVTCPMVMDRLRRDAALGGFPDLNLPAVTPGEAQARVGANGGLGDILVLEDLSFSVVPDGREEKMGVDVLAEKLLGFLPNELERLRSHLVVLRNADFAYFVQHATQVSARIALTGGKTTGKWVDPATGNQESGNLWYEETLPPETIMYSLLMASEPRGGKKSGIADADGVLRKLEEVFSKKPYLQVGGNETVGHGWCAIKFSGGA